MVFLLRGDYVGYNEAYLSVLKYIKVYDRLHLGEGRARRERGMVRRRLVRNLVVKLV